MHSRPFGLILAGGQSRRMGRNKALVTLGGQTLIERIASRIDGSVSRLAVNAPADTELPVDYERVPDTLSGHQGPLAGILTGMRWAMKVPAPPSHILTVAVDTPFIPGDLADRLEAGITSANQIILARSTGQLHPVVGLWPVALADDLRHWLSETDNRRLQDYTGRHDWSAVDFDKIETKAGALDPFFNINSPDDLVRAEQYLESLTP